MKIDDLFISFGNTKGSFLISGQSCTFQSLNGLYFLFVIFNLQIPGLMPRQFDRVKLHMTVLNTIFRKDDSDFQEEKAEQQQRETLDARSLLKVA